MLKYTALQCVHTTLPPSFRLHKCALNSGYEVDWFEFKRTWWGGRWGGGGKMHFHIKKVLMGMIISGTSKGHLLIITFFGLGGGEGVDMGTDQVRAYCP